MFGFITKIIGDNPEKELKRIQPIVDQINELDAEVARLPDDRLRDKTAEFRGRFLAGETLDSLLPEAFAVVREAARRTIGQRHYDVQLIGGVVLHSGKIAEMRTGEGKTLVATLPAYLNALSGEGVHVVTVNDYLAKRDSEWMGPIYRFLGLSVGAIQHDMDVRSRREAYGSDVTYGTNNEFGFDYLRDNMVWSATDMVQRGLEFAIVDEIDNILIDEARTPLIISGPAEESTEYYHMFARIVPRLRHEEDFTIDEKQRSISLTEEGIAKVEHAVGVSNLYDAENYELTHYLDQALKAEFLYKLDRDYIVKDGEVVIIDEFTGRQMPGRRYGEGLHQAIEAKEGVRVQRENVTLATITFQNYFRMYRKLAGMTGTASTEQEEFRKIYNLDVIPIPTNRPMIRRDQADVIYKTENAKFRAVVDEIKELNESGRPVLVGTVSIEKSERLSEMLRREGIRHEVLNAKQHEREAAIIAQAGRPGSVTIATNMAGRGVDILLGGNPAGLAEAIVRRKFKGDDDPPPEAVEAALAEASELCERDHATVVNLGGLHIIGTERHEARRIDNQLRGRAGRQGDPGSSRFYISLEDDLMRRFGGSTISNLMDKLGLEEDVPLEHGLVSKSIETAQQKVESHNFDIRKHVVEYDDVMNKQREIVYADRKSVLGEDTLRDTLMDWVDREIDELVSAFCAVRGEPADIDGLLDALAKLIPTAVVEPNELEGRRPEEINELLKDLAASAYEAKEQELGPEVMRQAERAVVLRIIDSLWVRHLTALDDLRNGIGLRAYGQRDPLVEYKVEAHRMFEELQRAIQHDVAHTIFHVTLAREQRPRVRPQPAMVNRRGGSQPAKVGKKIGRNDPCYCGSGKKYKYCCGR
ncbi:MAG TPA: preprotein translocase subunit SecA [Chloroflexota bacterium]|nr:preprotein translocase subunit SecA [Chloroflexota bacterium]